MTFASQPLLDWLATTGYSKAAVHLDVDVVGLTIAECVPRQALRLREILHGLPIV